jgi:hypothetical protein
MGETPSLGASCYQCQTPMDGIPPALPTDSEDIAWALETAEALWRRGERVDAVVWVRRAAQAAGEGEDAKRAAALARYAAELGDWIGSHTITGESIEANANAPNDDSLDGLDSLLIEEDTGQEGANGHADDRLAAHDVEVVSAQDFEAGFASPKAPEQTRHRASGAAQGASDPEIMTVSVHAPDVEILEDIEEFPEEEPTPVIRHPKSPVPDAPVPSAAEAHAGILDPWAEAEAARRSALPPLARPSVRHFDDEEVVTSAKRNAAQPPRMEDASAAVPHAPKAPRVPATNASRGRAPAPPTAPEEADTTTYRQINPRSRRAEGGAEGTLGGSEGRAQAHAANAPPVVSPPRPPPPPPPAPRGLSKSPLARPPLAPPERRAPVKPARPSAPRSEPAPPTQPSTAITKPASARPVDRSLPPSLDLLELVDSVSVPEVAPGEELAPESPAAAAATARPRSLTPDSARPTAPPPSGSMPSAAVPSGAPTRPKLGPTLLDLGDVEALSDLPDDAREAFAGAATMHKLATDEEVSQFALALVVAGEIDVSAQIVDAPALRLTRNAILRSRGTIVPGVALRLVCASTEALIATWDDAAVKSAFRTCPWVEEDLLVVTDRVQAKAGVTMGPLGERFDQSLRDHLTNKLTVRNLAPGEILVAQGKPTPIGIVGIGELVLTRAGARPETLRPGDFVFPTQILAHAPAPATAAAGPAGAVVLYGDRAVAQELLMGFPPLLEVLATL